MMTERPILFSGEMVRAVLGGRKTQTRRVMRLQPESCNGGWLYDGRFFADDEQMKSHLFHDVYGVKGSPYGSVYGDGSADSLWVRETWSQHCIGGSDVVFYRADSAPDGDGAPWRPSIFMPRGISRINLDVVNIRVERVQEITTADAMAEGCPVEYRPESCNGMSHAVHGWFEYLWDSINLKRGYGWAVNPWVWVVEFAAATRHSADTSGAILDRP